jgi:hypothetical protein
MRYLLTVVFATAFAFSTAAFASEQRTFPDCYPGQSHGPGFISFDECSGVRKLLFDLKVPGCSRGIRFSVVHLALAHTMCPLSQGTRRTILGGHGITCLGPPIHCTRSSQAPGSFFCAYDQDRCTVDDCGGAHSHRTCRCLKCEAAPPVDGEYTCSCGGFDCECVPIPAPAASADADESRAGTRQGPPPRAHPVDAVADLLNRTIGAVGAAHFVLQVTTSADTDSPASAAPASASSGGSGGGGETVMLSDTSDGKVLVSGSSAQALGYGVGMFLREVCNTSLTWVKTGR